METRPYQVDMIDRNVRVMTILNKSGEPTDDSGLNYLCWLTEEESANLAARYGEILTVQPLTVADPESGSEPMEAYSIRLTKGMEAYAVKLGDGNRSAGILKALAFAKGQGVKPTKAKPSPV